MQVKVYEAQDMRSAIEKVKKDLGPEALILSSRNIYKAKFGRFGKSWIEVTAAVDNSRKSEREDCGENDQFVEIPPGRLSERVSENAVTSKKAGRFEQILEKNSQKPVSIVAGIGEDGRLFNELRQMKKSFRGLARDIAEIKGQWPKMFSAFQGCNGQAPGATGSENKIWKEIDGLGFGSDAMQLLSEKIEEAGSFSGEDEGENLDTSIERAIADILEIKDPLSCSWEGQKRLSFIGPTGVGKTTTIAKVVANYLLNSGKNIALATIDNYRIAAVEQLKIYGQIMNVPVETARSPQQLKHFFERNQDKDLILVDTAGRSPKDDLSLQELSAFLDPALKIENHLVLSVTTRENDMYNVIRKFRNIELQGLVFTKLDECTQLGSILNVQLSAGYPISFLTNGQKVPEDILQPESRLLARMMLQEKEVVEKWNYKENATKPKHCVH